MKANTTDHMKFSRLKRRLGLPMWQVTGLLESIWNLTAKSAPRGDIGKYTNEDIAAKIEWEGDEHMMIDELVKAGWLDECQDHRLVVHDWPEHCPNYIKGGIKSRGEGFAVARPPKQQGLFNEDDKPEKPKPDKTNKKKRDPMFDAVALCHGIKPGAKVGSQAAKRVSPVAAELRSLGASPDDVPRRWKWITENYPGATINALPKQWEAAGRCLANGSSGATPRRKPEPGASPEDRKVGTW
jgi:hypothetical protein